MVLIDLVCLRWLLCDTATVCDLLTLGCLRLHKLITNVESITATTITAAVVSFLEIVPLLFLIIADHLWL